MAAGVEVDPLGVRLLYSPQEPEPPQQAFLLLSDLGVLEAFYGGAAGGGKSSTLLMDALRYVDVPGYAALLLRKTFADLALPGALMDRAHQWLDPTDARWTERDFRWTFPSGASLSFGYLQTRNDRYRYASAEFQYIGFDELTQFDEPDYRFLFTRLRRPSGVADNNPLAKVPLRMRSASNPGGRGHEWVKRRLVKRLPAEVKDGQEPDPMDTPERAARRVYIPAKLDDNPHVDRETYMESLAQVDATLRAQMLDGDWDAREPGDWVYNHRHLAAALDLGAELDELLEAGAMHPPRDQRLAIGLDWGNHTHGLIGWPLELRGMYVCAEVPLEDAEANAAALEVGARLAGIVTLGRRPRPDNYVDLNGARLPARMRRVGALPPQGHPFALVSGHRYDAAGIGVMRTYAAAVRRHHRAAKTVSVPFGAPAPRSGAASQRRSFKAETIGYVRRLLERTYAERAHPTIEAYVRGELQRDDWAPDRVELEVKRVASVGRLAISPKRCPVLREQLHGLEWLDRNSGQVRKENDHGPDALIALEAPDAIGARR